VDDVKHHSTSGPGGDFRVPANNVWAQAWKMAAVVAAIGLVVAIFGYTLDSKRFAFSYLVGFFTVLTMGLGSVFFVLIQHLTGAGWSVTVRRASEFFVGGMVIVPLLALPNLLSLDRLYPWWQHGHGQDVAHAQERHEADPPRAPLGRRATTAHPAHGEDASAAAHGDHHTPQHAQHAGIILKKLPYLNSIFFFIRAVLYLLAWLWIGERFFRYSTAQDRTGDPAWTVRLQRFAPPAAFVFALSLTFAGVDWVMSLEPTWFSTMFGVRVFAASAVLGLALNVMLCLGLRRAGLVDREINTEHFHDLGKLMFGFLVFWAYITFCEFMLIWYAAIPEEVSYYHHRWDFPMWRTISISLVVIKFIGPFFLIISRNAKRNLGLLGLGAGWIATMHLVEMYWFVMPYFSGKDVPLSATGLMTDIACILFCVGAYLAVVFKRMLNHPVIPLRDPRLSRALNFVNA
jgi:hypothetical protein